MENEILKKLGERIRALRKAQRWSQEQLADAAGLNQKYISEVERGQVNASITVCHMIAQGLGITLSELTEGLQSGKGGEELVALFHQAAALDGRRQKIVCEVLKGVLRGIDGGSDL